MDVMQCMTDGIRSAIEALSVSWESVTDIRLRAGGCSSLTCLCDGGRKNMPLRSLSLDEEDLRVVLSQLCAGSVHTYEEGLLRGYFTPMRLSGVRVGAAGRMLCCGGRPERLQRLSSLCIRLPHTVTTSGITAARLKALVYGGEGFGDTKIETNREGMPLSTLFYAPPGEGKTTLLRCLIRSLCTASGKEDPLCAAVIDTGEELCGDWTADCTVDRFCGYGRGLGMEIATRAFAPQVIFCDEIGSDAEADEILRAQACGIPLIATAHADTLATLIRRPCFARLHESGVFSRYVRLYRSTDGGFSFVCERVG